MGSGVRKDNFLRKRRFVNKQGPDTQHCLEITQHVDDHGSVIGIVPLPSHQLFEQLAVRHILQQKTFFTENLEERAGTGKKCFGSELSLIRILIETFYLHTAYKSSDKNPDPGFLSANKNYCREN
jgi:hypothetical protein